jgi:putative heme-binding domain-containing protein
LKIITRVLLHCTLVSTLCGSFAWGDHVNDNQPSSASFECHWTDSPPVIDGRADEPTWEHAQPIDHFYLPWLGSQAKPPRTATRARLLWDRKHLYFFADLEDKDLFADIDQRDGKTWHNDVLELFFKPGDSEPGYYEFHVSAAGTHLDIFIPQRQGDLFERFKSAQPFHFESKVIRRGTLNVRTDQDQGWSVEGKIPWTDFVRTGGRPAVGEVWRFAICRYDYNLAHDTPELSTCAPLQRLDFHRHEDYATLRFLGAKEQPPHPLWKTSRVVGSPDPPAPFHVVRTLPDLTIKSLIAMRFIPGSRQMLISGRDGPELLQVDADGGTTDSLKTLVDYTSRGTAYDITFHPDFRDNGWVYIGSNEKDSDGERETRVTRYTMQTEAPFQFDVESAKVIIAWPSAGHDGAAIAFGIDGMLYVTSGDGTSDSDANLTGQPLDSFLSKVLRIDVDHPVAPKQYSIPADNPFLDMPDAQPETWAYGLRNPWRIAVDRQTGHVWVGNNGQDLWEQIHLVERGANYGWSVYEGSHPFYLERQLGPTPHVHPTIEHHHAESRSLTGGVVYYGSEFPELVGAYIYGDYSTGKIWAAKHDGQKVVWHREIADTTLSISCFSEDSDGELIIAGHQQDGFYRLERNPRVDQPVDFPTRLSETGLFTSTSDHQLQPGVIPYSVNAPGWHDGARATRFMAFPATAKEGGGWESPGIPFNESTNWELPEGTVLGQSLTWDSGSDQTNSQRRLETRLLTLQNNEWAGYSYLWNDDQSDALLVEAMGTSKTFSDSLGNRTWHVPSRSECEGCHSRAARFVLGITTPQLNRSHQYNGATRNQLQHFENIGLLEVDWKDLASTYWRAQITQEINNRKSSEQGPTEIDDRLAAVTDTTGQRQIPLSRLLPDRPEAFPTMSGPSDPTALLESRARSYLHVNCSSCHSPAGGGNAQMNLGHSIETDQTKTIDEKPLHGDFGLTDARLISPGAPHQSVIIYRMSTLVGGRMPRVGSHRVDQEGLQLLREWIASMRPPDSPQDSVQKTIVDLSTTNSENSHAALDRLLHSSSGALALVAAIDNNRLSPELQEQAKRLAFREDLRLSTAGRLFERYLPEEQRTQTLGTNIDPTQILKLTGNPLHGQRLFMRKDHLSCLNCHRYQQRGHNVGPDLKSMKNNTARHQILESLLEPSKKIDEKFAAYTVVTLAGQIYAGLILERGEDFVILKQAGGKQVRIATEDIEELAKQNKSLMPDQVLKDLTAQQAADLLAFLQTLPSEN